MSSEQSCCSCSCQGAASSNPCGVIPTDSTISHSNRIDHILARWGYNRSGHLVTPGLYQLGSPDQDSPIFASANYTLSFDALRSALEGINGYILVLDTKGINVWCAAGKGTFGTDELVLRIESSDLSSVVSHRKIIVPQLGAPGVSAQEVQRRSGFRVEYGPVRAVDLPEYLRTGKVTPQMRMVKFPLHDRVILAPVELVYIALKAAIVAIILWFMAGQVASLAAITAVLTGTVLFPALLPYLPTKDFSTKGLILGFIVAIPFSYLYALTPGLPGWAAGAGALVPLLIIPAVVAFMALNFTGSTTFTSRTGVKKEIFRYVPIMAGMAVLGIIIGIVLGACRLMGMI
ncbi:MAG: carbon monoxide dehydrogenase [Methanospirillum sp.]|uniref:mercury methylation corrinoid protein HgcA n=1 Tax=Methanospirillum sp. TaxID=45200 RepID=UPI00236F8944|nr:mercury methylation corrinoid protein HgcA [Methanospirillum sp.]MDD1727993.1 carbon monoxide dehydrogenase [Methanospirillum sp.]